MATKQVKITPTAINLDASYPTLLPNEAVQIHNYQLGVGKNGNLPTGTGNDTSEGQNEFSLKPLRSNKKVEGITLPIGTNTCVGLFESPTTQELYYLNQNSNLNHGVYIIDGNTLQTKTVLIDPELDFSLEPEHFVAEHRATLRVTYDKNKNTVEKFFIFTDGNKWQRFINVIASIETNGFNANAFPYFALQPPHFDRRELFEYATRPPMITPKVRLLDNTEAENNRINRLIDKAFQFAYSRNLTDGRKTTLSPWSLPEIIKSEVYLANPQAIPKRIEIVLDGGSPLVESTDLYVRTSKLGDWKLYDTIKKYDTLGTNDPATIGDRYWLRTNPYAGFDYDPLLNTFTYIFSNDRVSQLTDPETTNIFANELPNRNIALSDFGDGVVLANNEHGYDNFAQKELAKFDLGVREKEDDFCTIPTRRIRLYATLVEDAGLTQAPYFVGEDEQTRFGAFAVSFGFTIDVNNSFSEFYELNFADRQSLRCYLKGTSFFADGKWLLVDQDFNFEDIDEIYDIEDAAQMDGLEQEYRDGKMFICAFDFVVPAGIYVATLGRHNVNSDQDWVNTSTYIAGIANSRNRFNRVEGGFTFGLMRYSDLQNNTKEIEINCLTNDVDVWGNGNDLFYVFAPQFTFFSSNPVQRKYKLVEGYLRETPTVRIAAEYYPYNLTEGFASRLFSGVFTDKNGFYWAFISDGDAREADIQIWGRKDCIYNNSSNPIEIVDAGIGNWANDTLGYLSDTTLGACNRVVVTGSIRNATNTFGFSNVSVHIFGGGVTQTDENGDFELIVHNGLLPLRTDKIYISPSSNYTIRNIDCSYIIPFTYREDQVPCVDCTPREITPSELTVNVNIASGSGQRSLKQGGKYPIGVVGFDLAGRHTFVNLLTEQEVSSFLQRNNTNPTELIWELAQALNLEDDIKWLGFFVAPNVNYNRYLQWIGDSIEYLDNRGEVTLDTATAEFVRIKIDSLLETNIKNNFTLLAGYQFVKGDRLTIYDDGEGQLFDNATFGEPIDVEIYGTNYNDAAIKAGLAPSQSTIIINQNTPTTPDPTTLLVRYDRRFDKLQNKQGFWLEINQPAQTTENIFYGETIVYPVVNGTIAEFTGFAGDQRQYNYLLEGIIPFWDTYYVDRIISLTTSSSNYLNHPFETPNVTDLWGANYISSGRPQIENKEAKKRWFRDEVIRSDEFVNDGIVNGLWLFRNENKKSFKGFLWGGIVAMIPQRNAMLFICESGWFVVSYNVNYARVDQGQFVVVNLTNNLGDPTPKSEDSYGCEYSNTKTIIAHDGLAMWHDLKNAGYIICNFQSAFDATDLLDGQGRKIGIKSYYRSKTNLISKYNNEVATKDIVDVMSGIDMANDDLFITFRPRRNNSNNPKSYVNQRRGYSEEQQETFVFNLKQKRWARTTGFTPECYGKLRGKSIGVEFLSFAAGQPYRHNDPTVQTFNNFFGVDCERHLTVCVNDSTEVNKVLQSVALDSNRQRMFSDLIYGNEPFSFSRISLNRWVLKENLYFAETLMDESSYPPTNGKEQYKSMLFDGKPMYGLYFIMRLVGDPINKQEYQELNAIFIKFDAREASFQK